VTAAAPEPTPPSSTVNALILKFAEQKAGPTPQADNWEVSVASTRPLAASKPIPATTSYVAVVSTHKDKDAAERAFAELQLQYPKVLRNRRSGLKEVRVGEKGKWYRVFILPPGTRQQATDSCARLAAAGHDRCWVKEYHSD
jgi:cell division protein FtsN